MDKPKFEPSPEGLLPRRKDLAPPPPARLTEPSAAVEDVAVEERPDRFRDPETRNLLLSLLVVALFALLFVAALFLAGPQAPVIAAGSSFVSFITLWILWRMGLHGQPNGLFLSVAIAGFVAMFVPLAAGLVMFLNEQQIQRRLEASEPASSAPQTTPSTVPRLADRFKIDRPDAEIDDYVRVIRESRVKIDGESFLIEMGEEFPLYRVAEGEVIFKAQDFLISLPPDVLRVFRAPLAETSGTEEEPAAATPAPEGAGDGLSPVERAKVTREAQAEATKRYPALAVKDTNENVMFLETYNRLKASDSELLKDPEWPLQIAEALAEREGWRRDDIAPPPPPARAIPVQPNLTAESPEDDAAFPPFDPTPPPFDPLLEELPLPQ